MFRTACVLTYRCLHGLGLDYFSSEFTRVSDLRPRQRLRSASTAALIVPATRHSTLGDRAFPVIGARLWNSLPDDIATATSLLTFRHKLKTFLCRRSYANVDSWLLFYRFLNFFYFFWFLFFSSCFNLVYCNVVLQCFCTYTTLISSLWWWWWMCLPVPVSASRHFLYRLVRKFIRSVASNERKNGNYFRWVLLFITNCVLMVIWRITTQKRWRRCHCLQLYNVVEYNDVISPSMCAWRNVVKSFTWQNW